MYGDVLNEKDWSGYFRTWSEQLSYCDSEEDIYDYCVLEYPFALWQWGTPVSTIPSLDDDDNTWFSNLMNVAEPDYFRYPNKYMPFDVQAIKELGYYGYSL